MHMEEGAAQGLEYEYRLLDLDELKTGLAELLAQAKRQGFDGLNITYPCKQTIIPLLNELSPDARAINAVNTVVIRDGRLVGHNTDASGFAEGFRRGLPDARLDRAVLLGAGGAGAAVAHAARKLGVRRLSIFDVDAARAADLAGKVGGEATDDLSSAMRTADGLIHCTPTGMAKMPGLPLDAGLIAARHWVAEIVYFPLETELLRAARAKGCRTVDGSGMAVFQAVGAFRLFTGLEPDAGRMIRTFKSFDP